MQGFNGNCAPIFGCNAVLDREIQRFCKVEAGAGGITVIANRVVTASGNGSNNDWKPTSYYL